MQHTYNVCKNKGNCRVWIEGQRLIDAGWPNGARFDKDIVDGVLYLTRSPEGRHKVAGTAQRPIIDLCGKYLNPFLGGFTKYQADFAPDTITITPAEHHTIEQEASA